jgi:hypothetical protein
MDMPYMHHYVILYGNRFSLTGSSNLLELNWKRCRQQAMQACLLLARMALTSHAFNAGHWQAEQTML